MRASISIFFTWGWEKSKWEIFFAAEVADGGLNVWSEGQDRIKSYPKAVAMHMKNLSAKKFPKNYAHSDEQQYLGELKSTMPDSFLPQHLMSGDSQATLYTLDWSIEPVEISRLKIGGSHYNFFYGNLWLLAMPQIFTKMETNTNWVLYIIFETDMSVTNEKSCHGHKLVWFI